jgi:prolyl 4-hydroxylase
LTKPLSVEWRDWLRLNRERGCDPKDLFDLALTQDFDPESIALVLGDRHNGARSKRSHSEMLKRPALVNPEHSPRAWRIDTDLAEIYEIPSLLTRGECLEIINAIDQGLVPSTVTSGLDSYRTSRTCHLQSTDPNLTNIIDGKFASLLGVSPLMSEPLQGQRYDTGQYFKPHTDFFDPGTDEYKEHTRIGGQRTWTLMVYLNTVELGGETRFERIGRSFTPIGGLGLAWNNLYADGTPNHDTLHEALPVECGRKYVITKWFRSNAVTQ